ncbi:MAG: 5-formyltetrahydrofolate cyclo-ligase [Anaerotignum sp.]|nr:5-formyltetrahydrofolate cyclo-ligase [Anaerotignum sp.]MBR6542984.1 5-formyltetrahydrofolate cyclo-ligase [Anaerotignum sp.]
MKKKLREEALTKRNNIPAEAREKKSESAAVHILKSEAFRKAEKVFTFVNMGAEIETREIIKQAWKEGKIVAVPKTEKRRVMYFIPIDSFDDLQEGRFGVMEPKGTAEDAIVPAIDDLFLVPGALFDRKKHRIGYGGGYYDTYFEKYKGYRKVGLAFSEQISDIFLPAEAYDVPLDDIVTENGWEE